MAEKPLVRLALPLLAAACGGGAPPPNTKPRNTKGRVGMLSRTAAARKREETARAHCRKVYARSVTLSGKRDDRSKRLRELLAEEDVKHVKRAEEAPRTPRDQKLVGCRRGGPGSP